VAGDDVRELVEDGPLDRGLEEIRSRANDGVAGNEVAAITLEIGGNDLLDLYDSLVLTGDCPSLAESLRRQECIDGLQGALDAYRPNLDEALTRLEVAAPGVPVFLMTLYNPFSGGPKTLDEIGALSLEGEAGTPFAEGLNDIIRQVGAEHSSVVMVEWYELFLGKQREYISQDLIHPNNVGHRVLADAVLAAMGGVGLP
jgi:lysophospholipase L1-like esterase